MSEQVWLDETNGTLHVSFMDQYHFGAWAFLDPQGLIRAMEAADPPMEIDNEFIFLGDL